MDGKYYNLWSTDNDKIDANDNVVIKSVYDPSPVGYSLPASNAFTGFTTTGGNVGEWNAPVTPEERAKLNVKGNWDKGWYCYTKPGKQGIPFFFQATGWRVHSTGQQERYSSSGWNWNAGSYSDINGSCFGYKDTTISPFDYNIRSMGQPVRSAEEKKWKYVCFSKLQMMFRLRRFIMRRLEEFATPSPRWTDSTITCGVRIMIRLKLMMKW